MIYILRASSWEDVVSKKYDVGVFDEDDLASMTAFSNGYLTLRFASAGELNRFVSELGKKKVEAKKKRIAYREVFVSDVQIPFQDDKALDVFFELAPKVEPDLVFLGGDIADFFSVSSWLSNPERQNLVEEVQEVKKFLIRLRKTFPKQKIIWLEGNHEQRIIKELWKNAGRVAGLSNYNLHPVTIFDLPKFGIEYMNEPYLVGKLYHIHGHEERVRVRRVMPARGILENYKRNVICGHWHVFDMRIENSADGQMKGVYVNGCLCEITKMPKPTYEVFGMRQQKGFSYVEYDEDGFFEVTQVKFIEEKTKKGDGIVQGKLSEVSDGNRKFRVMFKGEMYVF